MYSSLLDGHLAAEGFGAAVKNLGSRLVDATIDLHRSVMLGFLPSAVKFHYQFNLRELSNITQVTPSTPPPPRPAWLQQPCGSTCTRERAQLFRQQGLCQMTREFYKEPAQAVQLWAHECDRVLADRMVSKPDLDKYADMRVKATKKYFSDVPQARPPSCVVASCRLTLARSARPLPVSRW